MNNYSVSNKYHVEYVELKNDLYNKNNLYRLNESWIGKPRFKLVNIVRDSDDLLVYSYKQRNEEVEPCNKFIFINNEDWWIGGKDYEYKILINLESGEIYDESIHLNISRFSNRVFIWKDVEVSPDGKTLLIFGSDTTTKGVPCKFRLFDISNLFLDGIEEISLRHVIGFDHLYEFEKNSQWVSYNFNDNNSIVKKRWDYVNNIFNKTDDIIIFKKKQQFPENY